MTKWFTADLHLGHGNIIKYCKRPFSEAAKMNITLVDNIFKRVKFGDELYILGDIGFDVIAVELLLKMLQSKGVKLYYITGNHDSNEVMAICNKYCSVSSLLTIHYRGETITMSHYAMRVWPKSHFNSWQLYGHSHGKLKGIGKQFDVGVDVHNYRPINFDEVCNIMKTKDDNFNLLKESERNK